ncbi:MAG: hypothetical protein ACR2LK_05550 [Solirubrobacteraceae bacterium]
MRGPRSGIDVRWQVPAVSWHVALFALDADAALPDISVLDAAWASYGLRGAALMLPIRCGWAYWHAHSAPDALLCANVLLRTRGYVLTANAPLILDSAWPRALASDDPRLVALAHGPR